MRGVSGLLLLLLLALLAAASLLALVAVGPQPPPGAAPGGGGSCRAGPVMVEARVAGGVLEVLLQPPNPCYRLQGLRGFVEGGDGVAVVRVEGLLEEPGEGVVCPQVLPPPERLVVELPGGVGAVELEVVLRGGRGVYSCGVLLGVGGEG